MELQFVLGNPQPKIARKSRKKRSGLSTSGKRAKLKKKAGGNPVAKRKKMKKGSPAAKAWGRKMKRLRMAAEGNPRGKRRGKRKNPAYYQASGRVPVTRQIKGRSNKFYTDAEIAEFAHAHGVTASELKNAQQQLQNRSLQDILLMKELGTLKSEVAKVKKLQGAERAEARKIANAGKGVAKAERFKNKVLGEGGSVEAKWSKNPKGKKKKKNKKKRTAAQRAATKRMIAANKKKRGGKKARKKSGKRGKRRGKKRGASNNPHVFKAAKTFKFKRAKKKVRVKLITVVNPTPEQMKAMALPLLKAAAGYALMVGIYKAADSWSGGKISAQAAQYPKIAPFVLPAAGIAMGIGVPLLVRKVMPNKASGIEAVGRGAVMVGGVLAAVAAVQVAIGMVKPYVPATIAQNRFVAPFLSGVMYFPGMHGADFGMYPQMGDGYRQSAGDFGVIPRGLRGIPEGMRGVEYFPTRAAAMLAGHGMGEVQYYPDGSDGDRMFRQSEAGDLLEAEGLGSADFGEVPEGMGDPQQGGQMG